MSTVCLRCGGEVEDRRKAARGGAWHVACYFRSMREQSLPGAKPAPWECPDCGETDRAKRPVNMVKRCVTCWNKSRRAVGEKRRIHEAYPFPPCVTCFMRYPDLDLDGRCPLCILEGVTHPHPDDIRTTKREQVAA